MTALVTGGARGIGEAIVRRLAADGFEVVVADLDGEGAARVADEVGGRAVTLDVSDFDAVRAAIEEVGPLKVLVNNAGIEDRGWITEMTPERWRRMLAINLEAVFATTAAALPAMQEARYGRLVYIASEAGRIGGKSDSVYAATKGGVLAFAKSMAREGARYGITSNAIAPGPIETPLLREIDERGIELITRGTQLRRLGTPEEVAATVSFFASEGSSYVTGEVLGVSGGMGLSG